MVFAHSFNDIINEIDQNTTVNLPPLKENGLMIAYCKDDKIETIYSGLKPPLPFAKTELYHADICSWKRLTLDDVSCKAVYEVTFNVKDSKFEFKSGDTIGIVPHNTLLEVETVINHLELKSDADVPYHLSANKSIKGSKIPPHIPVKSTLKHVLTYCVDLRGILKKLFLLALSRYTKNENERRVLEFLCSKEGATAYQDHILNKSLTLIDIFKMFKSCTPPVEVILANLPRLLPRPYSIVNTGVRDLNIIKICFSVKNIGNNRKGLTTGWLEQLITRDSDIESQLEKLSINQIKVPIYVRKNMSGFTLPQNLDVPMILIGPGTGIAPYLSFLEEIKIYRDSDYEAKGGEIWMYFGCRNAKLDFIYEEELSEYLNEGILTRLRMAFSRMDDSDFKYIQNALANDGESIVRLIKEGAHIFICGDLKTLAGEVREIIVNSLINYDGMSKDDAEKFICDMQKSGRYLVDVWS